MFRKLFRPKEPQLTLIRSMEELKLKQAANSAAWGLGNTDRWDANLDLGTIQFSSSGKPLVTAQVQVVGTYNPLDGTWLWGWDHPSVDEPLAQAARLARDFGVKYGLPQYTQRKVECSEAEAWQFTAVAQHLSEATGAYRGPFGTIYVFMTFDQVEIRSPPETLH